MNTKHARGISRFLLTFALLIPLTFAAPVSAATSSCTTTITTVGGGTNWSRTFVYIVWGTITGHWMSTTTLVIKNITYTVTTDTTCAPR